MANAYTGGYEGISSNELPEAEKMRSALNSLEKVEHKISAAEWAANKNSETKYPTCAAVQKAVDEAWVYPVTDPQDFSPNSSRLPSAGAVYRFVESTEKDIEKKANLVTAAGWEANKDNETKYPSCAAVNTAVGGAAAVCQTSALAAVIAGLTVTLAQTINSASTHAQMPSAQAVWSLWSLAKNSIWTLNVSPYTGVKLRKFEIKTSVSSTPVNRYTAVRLGVSATLSAGDVLQSVKDHINTTWGGNSISDANCQAYLQYAHRTPGVWRLPTEAEWVYGRSSGMFWDTNPRSSDWEWCCDSYGDGHKQAITGVNPVYWSSTGTFVRRRIFNDQRHQLYATDTGYHSGRGWGSSADGNCYCRLARTATV